MAKRTKKNDAAQKNKQGFDSAVRDKALRDTEFSGEFGSAAANQMKKEKEKQQKAYLNGGQCRSGL